MSMSRRGLLAGALALVLPASLAVASPGKDAAAADKCHGATTPGNAAPAPSGPYPLTAAGWGPELGGGLLMSRWAEDWTGVRGAGTAPAGKAIPLGSSATLTLSAELRLRQDVFDNGQLVLGNDMRRGLFRGVAGADLRLGAQLRLFGELGTAQVDRQRGAAPANFQNMLSLQQLFVDVRGPARSALVGAMVGRQEFSDGPRQLISMSDGPNLHRTWNGVRAYVHGERARIGAFDLRTTRLDAGWLGEGIDNDERLRGVNASIVVSRAPGPNTYLEPFWYHSENPAFRSGASVGPDARDTIGARLWGREGRLRFDWTVARQSGHYMDRRVDAWGVFAVQSLDLTDSGWKPRLTSHIDVASGGSTFGSGTLGAFNQLYASSSYLGEGQFLGLSNLLLVAAGIAFSPAPNATAALEYGFARRLDDSDIAYAGGMRVYARTQEVQGRQIGGLARLSATFAASTRLTMALNFEHFEAGPVLERARYPSGSYVSLAVTYRY